MSSAITHYPAADETSDQDAMVANINGVFDPLIDRLNEQKFGVVGPHTLMALALACKQAFTVLLTADSDVAETPEPRDETSDTKTLDDGTVVPADHMVDDHTPEGTPPTPRAVPENEAPPPGPPQGLEITGTRESDHGIGYDAQVEKATLTGDGARVNPTLATHDLPIDETPDEDQVHAENEAQDHPEDHEDDLPRDQNGVLIRDERPAQGDLPPTTQSEMNAGILEDEKLAGLAPASATEPLTQEQLEAEGLFADKPAS